MTDTIHDSLILGAGPAGLQLAYFLAKRKRDYLVLEATDRAGAFFQRYPRHGKLISINKVHTGSDDPDINLRFDWNSLLCDDPGLRFARYSQDYFPDAAKMQEYLADFAARFRLDIQYDARAAHVTRERDAFVVRDVHGRRFAGRRLIVATGLWTPNVPAIPGAELCETYATCSVDPAGFVNQRVLIVGKGNSAFETAQRLTGTAATIHVCSPNPVRLAWESHFVGNLRAVNAAFIDTYQLKAQNALIDATVDAIERDGRGYRVHLTYSHARGQRTIIPYDRVILCTGFRFDDSIFAESCRPALTINDRFPAQTSAWESTNVQDLYFAGTLMQACDYRRTMSGFVHGFRHNVAALARVLEERYERQPWPHVTIEPTAGSVMRHVMDRMNRAPSLFLQPGFLVDVLVVPTSGGPARYYEDIRRDYVRDGSLGRHEHYYLVTLEYGHFRGNPLAIDRDPDPAKGHEAPYLHPVIRRYRRDTLVAEHHLQDDLESKWSLDVYVEPALAFMEAQLAGATASHAALSPHRERDTVPLLAYA